MRDLFTLVMEAVSVLSDHHWTVLASGWAGACGAATCEVVGTVGAAAPAAGRVSAAAPRARHAPPPAARSWRRVTVRCWFACCGSRVNLVLLSLWPGAAEGTSRPARSAS